MLGLGSSGSSKREERRKISGVSTSVCILFAPFFLALAVFMTDLCRPGFPFLLCFRLRLGPRREIMLSQALRQSRLRFTF